MLPPTWALSGSTRLDLQEFSTAFSRAWSQTESRFLKLECWQAYREAQACESQEVYEHGDIETACELLRREAEADRPLYEDVDKRHLDYARIRLVQEPLNPYLRYELLSYGIRAEMGENIEVVRCDPALRLPSDEYFDVLLFDRRTALIHDYGTGEVGRQSGGWLTHEPHVLARLEEMILALREGAVPLQQYLRQARTEQS
ncbi:hypothetical protein OG417_08800 [Actinoallomurus sp. NBC_01490]|uniref:DUF6879 family protein n=1 Tax=Actinoallomurus sp. NBC_01490 TaxID=2903557 RepID=UPI002E32B5D5|nr:DUF6879 family protein [Actinoallomurus sp. NBC_01490]